MQYRKIKSLNIEVSTVGLGTWVMGGWMWGGAEDAQSEKAIEMAMEQGVNLIDTAPVYGFGRAEKIVGRTVERLRMRDRVLLATKCGLEWNEKEQIKRNASPNRIIKEIDDSRKRLRSDVIDIYQIHWPDEAIAFEKSMEVLYKLYDRGVIRAIGLSNYNCSQIKACQKVGPVHTLQSPLNLFERDLENEILPFCQLNDIAVFAYSAICRGLLSGKFISGITFPNDDVRSLDPKFNEKNLSPYLNALKELRFMAQEKNVSLSQLAIRWLMDKQGVTSALVGARVSAQAEENAKASEVCLTQSEMDRIENIVETNVPVPIPSGIIGPPRNKILAAS